MPPSPAHSQSGDPAPSPGAGRYGAWQPVIGLEMHAQLRTQTKLFCGCRVAFGADPNTLTCPVCLGLPGSLPVLNRRAVDLALVAALSLGCSIQTTSVFARKNYFYPDLPKGYQITQFDRPIALGGTLAINADHGPREVGITRIHMEEDAGKNVHAHGHSAVDLNRAGTPLIEIVGEPDLRSPAEAKDVMRRVRDALVFAAVNDGNLEQGSFRCDANVSIRLPGEPLGTRVELKNINSFRFVEEAVDIEIHRQIALLENGHAVKQQTRGYNSDKHETYLLREKKGEVEYRYFPDPDLPPLTLSDERVAAGRAASVEMPWAKADRYARDFALKANVISVLCSHPAVAQFFEDAVAISRAPEATANFVQGDVLRDATLHGIDASFAVDATRVGELVALVGEGRVSGKQAKQVYLALKETSDGPAAVIEKLGLGVLRDSGALNAHILDVLAANAQQAVAYRGGKTALLGFFIGQVMKKTQGSADPKQLKELLQAALTAEGQDT